MPLTHIKGPMPAYDFVPGYRPGNYYSAVPLSMSTTVFANNEMRLGALPVHRPIWIDRLVAEVTSAGADGGTNTVVRLGIYATGRDGRPDRLVVDAGTFLGGLNDGTGIRELTVAQRLDPGLYWLAQATQGAVGAGPQTRGMSASPLIQVGNSTISPTGAAVNSGYALPGVTAEFPLRLFGAAFTLQGAVPRTCVRVLRTL